MGGASQEVRGRARRLFTPLDRVFSWIEGQQPGQPGPAERFRTAVAILIAAVSVLGAIVAWRASVYSTDASNLDQQATQELVRRQQILASFRGFVSQDRRFHGPYQEHVKAATLLDRESRAVRRRNPVHATELRAQAQEERALARSLAHFFYSQTPDDPTAAGNVAYDAGAGLQYLEEVDAELPMLHPVAVAREARRLHHRTVRLVGVAAVFVVALFFLTLAELTRPAVRPFFAASGSLAFIGGIALFVLVGP